jgi:hypothetical protein
MPLNKDNAKAAGAKGHARMREITAAKEVAITSLIDELISALRRTPTPGERIEAELIATSLVRIRYLRLYYKDDTKERELLANLMKTTIWGSVPEMSPAERQHGRAVAEAIERHDAERGRRNSREPWVPEAGESVADEAGK